MCLKLKSAQTLRQSLWTRLGNVWETCIKFWAVKGLPVVLHHRDHPAVYDSTSATTHPAIYFNHRIPISSSLSACCRSSSSSEGEHVNRRLGIANNNMVLAGE